MRRNKTRKFILVVAGILLSLILILAIWSVVAGPVTVYRVITRGDTTVYDYKRFPGRSLTPSPVPYRFDVDLQDGLLPETIHLDISGGKTFDDLLETSKTLAFLIIQDDVLVFEYYGNGHSESAISQIFSTSKSILSILVGTAIDDGLITSVKDPVTKYVPELAGAGFENVTIENLLNMQSNMDYFENDNPFGEHVIFNFTNHLEDEILGLRVLTKPDRQFRYKSGDNALLGLILDRTLGDKTITQYIQERLWNSLGMEHGGVWGVDRLDGLERTWCCLSMSARDLAKFGQLYLQNGNWNGTHIVPPEWVETSTMFGAYTSNEWPSDMSKIGASNYKYQWWLLSGNDGDYSSWGKDGQFVYVNPQKGLVIVRLGETDGGLPWFRIFQEIAKEIQ